VRITVLGKSPSWQDAGGACSGYLVDDGETQALIDCGSGVFSKLRTVGDYADLDAIVVSHMHADHFIDLIPFACGLTYAPRDARRRPQLHLPPGGSEQLDTLVRGAGHSGDLISGAFALREYDPAGAVTIGSLHVRFQAVPHFIPTYAIELRSAARPERRFTYGADHRATDALDAFAAATDLLLLEATMAHPEADREGLRGHMTPAQAGALAARCGAQRLVLTHISDELDAEWALAQARSAFDGRLDIAREGAVYDV